MANEKTKYDKREPPATHKKAKRNKHQTACKDKRRSYFGCGICGSENICFQGVSCCESCGEEIDFISQDWFFFNPVELDCDCDKVYRNIVYTRIQKCMDCGAVGGPFCPNGKKHSCWKSGVGKRYCRTCGYHN